MIDRTRADVLGPPRNSDAEDIRQLLSPWPADLLWVGADSESASDEAEAAA